MAQQLITLAAALIGAIIGLLAPLLTNAIGRRERHHESQRTIAGEILDIFDTAVPLIDLLGPTDSRARRKLYLLALRLEDEGARRATMNLIAVAGGQDAEEVQEAWFPMMDEIGRVFRARGRK